MASLVVIGKNSYIGGRFSDYLAGLGVTNVLSLSSAECNFLALTDVQRFFRSLGRDRCTIIFLAAINKWVDNSYRSFADNSAMVYHLITGSQLVDINAIVYFSSVDVYGNRPSLPITEQSAINPNSWYALSKYVCEWMLLSAGNVFCPVTVLRIPGIYGRARNDRSVIGTIAAHILNSRPVPLTSGGQVLRDYVFVDDLCRLLYELTARKYNGVLNVATGNSLPMAEIVEKLGDALRMKPHVVSTSGNPDRDFDLVFDTARLKSLLPEFRFSDVTVGARLYLEAKQQGVSD